MKAEKLNESHVMSSFCKWYIIASCALARAHTHVHASVYFVCLLVIQQYRTLYSLYILLGCMLVRNSSIIDFCMNDRYK